MKQSFFFFWGNGILCIQRVDNDIADPNKGPGSIKYEPESESDEDIMLNADAMPGKSPSPGEYYRGKVSKEQPDESITNSSADEIKAEAF